MLNKRILYIKIIYKKINLINEGYLNTNILTENLVFKYTMLNRVTGKNYFCHVTLP